MRRGLLSGLAAVAALAASTVAIAAAQEQPASFMAADASRTGTISLAFFGPEGLDVQFTERVAGVLEPRGSARTEPPGIAAVLRATSWRCDRLVRHFEAVGTAADGTVHRGSFEVRTPSCRDRLAITVPARAARGSRIRVRVNDRWHLGDPAAELCVDGRCSLLDLPAEGPIVVPVPAGDDDGLRRIGVRVQGYTARATVAVGRAAPPPAARPAGILATGDSTMQGIDSFLSDELGARARVRSQVFVGTGISNPLPPGWRLLARTQAATLKPRTTVISIGANEGYPMATPSGPEAACCDAAWTAEYARRARGMMRRYLRNGSGHVLWLTLPVPRREAHARIVSAVNRAVADAARGLAAVRVVDLGAVFTPGGTFRATMPYRGRTIRVREPDGIHLSVAGTKIAAQIVARELRRLPGALG